MVEPHGFSKQLCRNRRAYVSTAGSQPEIRAGQNIPGRVHVSIQREAAMRTLMHADCEALRDSAPAARAHLRGSVWPDRKHHATSFFRFVGEHVSQGGPRGVVDRLAEIGARHVSNAQIFDRNVRMGGDKRARQLVQKVAPLPRHLSMRLAETLPSFGSASRCFLRSRKCSAAFLYRSGRALHPLRGGNNLSSAQGDKIAEAYIDANFTGLPLRLGRLHLDLTDNEPARPFSLHRDVLGLGWKGSVNLGLHEPSDAENTNPAILVGQAVADFEASRVKARRRLKAREARLLALLYSTEEGSERDIQALKDEEFCASAVRPQSFVSLPHVLQPVGLLSVRERPAIVSVAADPLFEGLVIQPAERTQHADQPRSLSSVGVQPIFVGAKH